MPLVTVNPFFLVLVEQVVWNLFRPFMPCSWTREHIALSGSL
jgi:hypothetical protein